MKLEKIKANNFLKFTTTLVDCLLKALQKRFANYFAVTHKAKDAIIAAIMCPNIKMRWVSSCYGNNTDSDVIKKLVVDTAYELMEDETVQIKDSTINFSDDFLNLMKVLVATYQPQHLFLCVLHKPHIHNWSKA